MSHYGHEARRPVKKILCITERVRETRATEPGAHNHYGLLIETKINHMYFFIAFPVLLIVLKWLNPTLSPLSVRAVARP